MQINDKIVICSTSPMLSNGFRTKEDAEKWGNESGIGSSYHWWLEQYDDGTWGIHIEYNDPPGC